MQLVGRESLDDGDRLRIEIAYCRRARERYSAWVDSKILVLVVLRCLRVQRGFSVDEVLELLSSEVREPGVLPLGPAVERVDR